MNRTRRARVLITRRPITERFPVLEHYAEVCVSASADGWTRDELLRRSRDAAAIMVFPHDTIDEAFLVERPRLQIVAGAMQDCGGIDLKAMALRGVWLTNVPELPALLTAHEARRRAELTAAANIVDVLLGRPPRDAVVALTPAGRLLQTTGRLWRPGATW